MEIYAYHAYEEFALDRKSRACQHANSIDSWPGWSWCWSWALGASDGQAVAHGEYIRTNTCERIYTIYTVILLTGHLARAGATDTLTNTHECVFVALNRHFHS